MIIRSVINVKNLYNVFLEYPEISTDTRKIVPNCLFFALKGANFDGNQFAKNAIALGARYAIIDDPEYYEKNGRYILVPNVLDILQHLARYHRRQLKTSVIAITGSNGKTTTKELITNVLSKKFNILATEGNYNNHIGLPLTLLRIRKEHNVAILEMGASKRGDIDELCYIAEPNFGIITNIGRAHLEGMGGPQGVLETKTELYHYLRQTNGRIFLNIDNDKLVSKAYGIKCFTYSSFQTADLIGIMKQENPHIVYDFANDREMMYDCKSHLMGRYNFENILTATAVGSYFGILASRIDDAIQEYKPENNRSQWVISRNKVLVDCYNANPSSMEESLLNFSRMPEKNKIVILGDMMELGTGVYDEHKRIIEIALEQKFKHIYLVGHLFSSIAQSYDVKTFSNTDEAIKYFMGTPLFSSSVLIKGSRVNQLEKLLAVL